MSGPAFRRFELMDTTYGALNPALEHLRDNRTSGAIDLALEALDVAQSWLAAGRSPLDLARELAAMHPAIATVRNMGALLSQRSDDLPAALRDVRRSLVEGNRRIAEKLKELLPVDAGGHHPQQQLHRAGRSACHSAALGSDLGVTAGGRGR